jgi:hypothetical protein
MTQYIDCSNAEIKKQVLEIIRKLKQGVDIANELNISNLLYNESYVDLLIAVQLGHKYNVDTQGADALEKDGTPTEYKAVKKKDGQYSGSFQFHWLSSEKIQKYDQCKHFYFVWRDDFEIEKIIKVKKEVLMPEIKGKAGKGGSTAGHKSFSCATIEALADKRKAEIVFQK